MGKPPEEVFNDFYDKEVAPLLFAWSLKGGELAETFAWQGFLKKGIDYAFCAGYGAALAEAAHLVRDQMGHWDLGKDIAAAIEKLKEGEK